MQVNPIISQSTREIRKHDFLRVGSHWVPSHKSQNHLRSICAISTVESMDVGTYHFTWVRSL